MVDMMRWCIMPHDAFKHQPPRTEANNSPMQAKTRQNILKLMELHGVESERQLALACGMQQSTLHRFMSGKTESLNVAHLMAIAQHFEVTVSQLIGEITMSDDPRIRTVLAVMETLPDYKKDMLVAASQSLAKGAS